MYAGKPRLMKQVNEALVRDALKSRGRATKNELGFDTGLSLTTVGQALSGMEKLGEIRAVGLKESSGGRKATEYELDAAAGTIYAIAVETGRIDWAIANALGTVLSQGGRLVREDPVGEALELVGALRRDLSYPPGRRTVLAVGIPGAVQDGRVITGDFADQWGDADIRAFFAERTGLTTVVENDINAAALGYERRFEANGQRLHSLVYIYFKKLCTGSGIVASGQVLRGARNFAGEIDYLPLAGGGTLRQSLPEVVDDRAYADAIATVLAAVNCVVNPGLFVVGGADFRFELTDAVETAYNARVSESVRPRVVFERDTMTHYLYGLCGLAHDAMFPSYRLVSGRI